ncbi:MAG: DUF309 domain-containing protein [Acidobacteriota bacterium]|nr:DUF309 domain-containing protein [Blastocatellia bacterium]MDW8411569.1 DUF309 domain-containing protein [Acidobacteriota bacterium]
MYYFLPKEHIAAVQLYNEGKFYEAHEEWEQLWKIAQGDSKLFYQALIQAAAALLHHQNGNKRGAEVCLAKSLEKLSRLPKRFLGIDTEAYSKSLKTFFAEELAIFPKLELQSWNSETD